jgi:hypothetical protein
MLSEQIAAYLFDRVNIMSSTAWYRSWPARKYEHFAQPKLLCFKRNESTQISVVFSERLNI